MRNLVIGRITEILVNHVDLQLILNISLEDLPNLSNVELLDLYLEILE
jgi:hypothetical protein